MTKYTHKQTLSAGLVLEPESKPEDYNDLFRIGNTLCSQFDDFGYIKQCRLFGTLAIFRFRFLISTPRSLRVLYEINLKLL